MALTNSFPTGLPAGLSVIDTRKTLGELIVTNSDGTPRLGVLPRNFNPIVTATSSMTYSIAGADFVTSRTGLGVELVSNDGAVTVATTAAPASNSRLDVIWVRSRFTASGDPAGAPEFNVTQGTASGTVPPPKPSIPAGALEIATAQIPAGATATNSAGVIITQTAQFTAASDATVSFRTKSALDLWTNATLGQLAQVVTDSDARLNGVYRWDGSAWSGNEFASWTTLIAGLPDNSVQAGLGSYTLVGASDATFCTLVTNGIQLNRPGTYLVEASFKMDLAATGRVFLSSVAGGIERRSHGMVGDDYSSPNVRTVTVGATPVQVIMGMFKNNGGVNNINGRVTVTRIN